MKDFERCLELRRRINELEEKITDAREAIRYPKTFSFSPEPRCGSGDSNSVERYLIRVEEWEKKKLLNETQLILTWDSITKRFDLLDIQDQDRVVMRLRYFNGYSWHKCTDIMRSTFGDKWNANRVFRVNRCVRNTIENLQIS